MYRGGGASGVALLATVEARWAQSVVGGERRVHFCRAAFPRLGEPHMRVSSFVEGSCTALFAGEGGLVLRDFQYLCLVRGPLSVKVASGSGLDCGVLMAACSSREVGSWCRVLINASGFMVVSGAVSWTLVWSPAPPLLPVWTWTHVAVSLS